MQLNPFNPVPSIEIDNNIWVNSQQQAEPKNYQFQIECVLLTF